MAITRYAGDRFTIAPTDTKPTGVMPGALLIDSGNQTSFIKTGYTIDPWAQIAGGGGGGTPGGSNTQVQFNNNGSFGGDADLTFTNSNQLNVNKLSIAGNVIDSNSSIGEGGMVLTNEGATGVNWKNIESVLSGVGGSGVANYVARWSDEDTLTSGTIYDDGNVGIGTTAPAQKLHSYASVGGRAALFDGAANWYTTKIQGSTTSHQSYGQMILAGTSSTDKALRIYNAAGNSDLFIVLGDGNVGIGTDAPIHKFQVNGAAFISGSVIIPNASNYYGAYNAAGDGYIQAFRADGNDNLVVNHNNFQGDTIIKGDTIDLQPYDPLNIARSTLIVTGAGVGVPGSVGIGITNDVPQHTLHVSGDIQVSGYFYDSTSSTGVDGYVLTSREDGPQWDYIEDILSGVGGNGTENYVPKWEDSDTIGNSIIYDDGTNVGISTVTPSGKFHVYGGAGRFDVTNAATKDHHLTVSEGNATDWRPYAGSTTAALQLQSLENLTGDARGILLAVKSEGNPELTTSEGLDINVNATVGTNNGTLAVKVQSDGKVGIGTTNPAQKLDVRGDIYISSGNRITWANGDAEIIEGATSNYSLTFNTYDGVSAMSTNLFLKSGGDVGIGTNAPGAKLDVYRNGGFTNDVPTARIYHRNNPDGGQTNVAALDVNVGMSNADLYHHGYVSLYNHFTGGAYNSPILYLSSNSFNASTNHRQWWGLQALADTTATGDRLAFTCDLSSANPTATPVHIMSLQTDGNVGIGVNAPAAKLDVDLDGGTTYARLGYDNYASFQFYRNLTASSTSLPVMMVRQTHPDDDQTALVVDQDGSGNILELIEDSTTRVVVQADGNVGIGTTNPGGRLETYVTAGGQFGLRLNSNFGGGNAVDFKPYISSVSNAGFSIDLATSTKFVINSDGNVGVGTNNPLWKFQVDGPAFVSGTVLIPNSSNYYGAYNAAGTDYIKALYVDTNDDVIVNHTNFQGNTIIRGDTLDVQPYDPLNVARSTLIVTGAGVGVPGSVGIGITTKLPQHTLHVSGDMQVSGYFYDSTSSTGVDGYVLTSKEDGPQWKMIEDVLSGVGGNGTADYVPRWVDSDTIGDSVIAQSGSAIGIGTAAPAEILEIVSDSDPTILIRPVTVDSANSGKISYRENAGGTTGVDLRYDGANNKFIIDTSDVANALVIKRTDGKVGIGVAAPVAKVHIDDSATGDNKALYLSNTHNTDGDSAAIRFGFAGNDNANKGGIFFQRTANYGRGSLIFATENTQTNDNVDASDTKLIILADGKVGIGTTAPSAALDVVTSSTVWAAEINQTNTSNGDGLYVNTGSTASADYVASFRANNVNVLAVKANGKVGIGTATPDSLLQIANANGSSYRFGYAGTSDVYFDADDVYFRSDNGGVNNMVLKGSKLGIGTASPTTLTELYQGSTTNPTELQITNFSAGDAFINFIERDATGNTNGTKFGEANAWGFQVGYDGGDNKFFIKSGNQETVVNRLTIQRDDGKVGIGTDDFTAGGKLQVYNGIVMLNQSAASNYYLIHLKGPVASFLGGSRFFDAHSYNAAGNAEVARTWFTHGSEGVFGIAHSASGTPAIRLVIATDGNVGIGITNPGYKLEVNGTAKLGALTGTTATFSGLTTLSGGARLMLGQALLGQTSGGTSTQLIYWGGTDIYYGRNATSPNNATVASHIFRAAGNTRLTVDNSNITLAAALTGTSATFSGDVKAAQFYTNYDWTSRSGGINIGNNGLTTGAVSFYDGVVASSASIYRDGESVFFVGARGGTNTAGIAIATDGNVGIGTTTPGSYKLKVEGTTWLNDQAFIAGNNTAPPTTSNSQDFGAIRMSDGALRSMYQGCTATYGWIQVSKSTDHSVNYPLALNPNGGDVGIGIATPGAKLDVAGVSRIQSTGPVLRFYDTDHDTHSLQMDLSGGNFRFYKYTGSTDASHSEIFRVTTAGVVRFNNVYSFPSVDGTAGYHLETDGAGAVTWQPGGSGTVTGTGTANSISKWTGTSSQGNSTISDNGSIVTVANDFHVYKAGSDKKLWLSEGTSGSGLTNVQLNPNGDSYLKGGDVGIGTATPVGLLDIIRVSNTAPALRIGSSATYGWGFFSRASTGDLSIERDNNTTYSPTLYLKRADGNVGIGTTNPTKLFHVNGASLLGGTTTILGNLLPGISSLMDIGTSSFKWRNLALSGTAIIDGALTGTTAAFSGTTNDGAAAVLTATQSGTGRAFQVSRTVASATRAMADFVQLHASGGTSPAVHIQQTTTASDALRITSDGATAKFAVTGTGALTGTSATFSDDITLTGTRAIKNSTSAGVLTLQGGASWPGGKIVLSGGNTPSTGDIKFYTGLSTGTPAQRLVITNDGNVGIGTTNPLEKVHIWGAGTQVLAIQGDSGTGPKFTIRGGGTLTFSNDNTPYMNLNASGRFTLNTYGSGTHTGTAAYKLSVTSGGIVIETPIGAGAVDGAGTTNYISKWTDGDTIGNSQIFDNGTNVGIGIASPSTEGLEIAKPSADTSFNVNDQADSILVLRNSDSGSIDTGRFCGITMKINSSSAAAESTIRTQFAGDGDADLIFSTTKAGTGADRMVLNEDGNVGIGTTNPSQLLHVNGASLLGGTTTVGGNLVGAISGLFDLGTPSFKWRNLALSGTADVGGALTGTTATFTGEVDLDVGLDWYDPSSSVYGRLGYGGGYVYVGALGATGILKLFSGGNVACTFAANKAATFASTVDVVGEIGGGYGLDWATSQTVTGRLGYGTGYVYIGTNTATGILKLYAGGAAAVHILADGNVGIGTTNPGSYKLKVEGTTWLNDQAFIAGNNTAPPTTSNSQDFGAIRMSDGGLRSMYQGCTATYGWVQVSKSTNHATNYPLALNPNGGDVGIGVAVPGEKLQISGTEAVIKLVDTAATSAGYIDFDGTSLQLNTNRNPNTGAFADTSKSHAFLIMSGGTSGSSFNFYTAASANTTGTSRLTIGSDGTLDLVSAKFKINGSGGTNGYTIVTDGSGNISWSNAGTGTVTGTGTANYVSKWTGTNSQGNSIIQDNGTTVTVGGALKVVDATVSYNSGQNRLEVDKDLKLERTTGTSIYMRRTTADTVSLLGKIEFGNNNIDSNVAIISAYQGGATDAGELRFETEATGGSIATRMIIKSDGKVGIGTTTPSAKLFIIGDSTSRAFQVVSSSAGNATGYFYTNMVHTGVDTSATVSIRSDHASSSGQILHVRGDGSGNLLTLNQGGTDRLVVQAAGNVGIGQAAPRNPLEVDLNQSNGTLVGDSAVHFGGQHHSSGQIMGLTLGYREANDNYRKVGIVAEGLGDNAARQNFHILVQTTNSGASCSLADSKLTIYGTTGIVRVHNKFGIGGDPGAHHLYAAGSAFITGSVGIGTATPGEKLTVWNSNISLGKRQNSVTSYIGKGTGANGQTFGSNSNWIAFASDAANDWITFGTHQSGVGGGERMRLNYDGNVGIGTTNPGYKLDVNGTGYFSGNVSMTSTSPTLNIAGAAVNQFESGRIRLTEEGMTGGAQFQGGYIHYDGSANKLNIGVHPDSNSTAGDDINAIQIDRVAGAVTFGAAGGTFFTQNISFTSTAKYITFYGNDNAHHGIGSRDGGGSEADDLRINTYGALYINLDSNGNNSSSADFHIAKHGGTGAISASDYLLMLSGETGKLQLKKYGSGTHTGTLAKSLGVDSSGNVIEFTGGTGTVTGTGTANYVSKWTGTSSQGNSLIQDDGSTVGIGTNGSSGGKLQVYGGSIMIDQSGASSKYIVFQKGPIASFLGGSPFFDAYSYNAAGNADIARTWFTHSAEGTFSISHKNTGTPAMALSIDTSANVGIGTTAPDRLLHIYKATAGSVTASSDAQLVVENSAIAAINLLSGSSSHGQILFGDAADNDDGQFGYDQANREFYWKTAGSGNKALKVYANDNVTVEYGKVGIGTTSPNKTLDVRGDIWLGASGTSILGAAGDVHFYADNAKVAEYWTSGSDYMFKSYHDDIRYPDIGTTGMTLGSVTAASTILTIYQPADDKGIRIYGYDDVAARYAELFVNSAGYTVLDASTDRGLVLKGHGIDFYVNSGGTHTGRWTYDGKLGVGTTAPTQMLEVRGTEAAIRIHDTYSNVNQSLLLLGSDLHASNTKDSWIKFFGGAATNDRTWSIGHNGNAMFRFNYLGTRATAPTGGTTILNLDGINNRVGIGTNAPATTLHVWSGGPDFGVGLAIQHDTSYAGRYATLSFGAGSYRKAAIAIASSGDTYGTGDLIFCVDPSNDAADVASSNERMRIKSDGKVGIGTTAPSGLLDLYDPASGDNKLRFHNSTTGTGTSNGSRIGLNGTELFINNHESSTIKIYTQSTQTNGICIANDGKVGIGSVTPLDKFHVQGNILQLDGSPEYHFGTTSASHRNWRVACQEDVSQGFEIASGTTSAGTGAPSDTYTNRFVIKGATGQIQFNSYGGGTHTGTLAKSLGVDSSGNVIEFTGGTGTVTGTGTNNYIASWNGTTALEVANIYKHSYGTIINSNFLSSYATNRYVFEVAGNPGTTAFDGGIINLRVASDTNAERVGQLAFINSANANHVNPNAAAGSRIAQIISTVVTTDSNAGDDSGGDLQFWTKAEAGLPAERMRITSDGKVGIGTTNPGSFETWINAPAYFDNVVWTANAGGLGSYDTGGTLKNILILNSSDELVVNHNAGGTIPTRVNGDYITFEPSASILNEPIETMRIVGGIGVGAKGCVGIGTNAPVATLEVAGVGLASGQAASKGIVKINGNSVGGAIHYDTYATLTSYNVENRFQLIAQDVGSDAGFFTLTSTPATGTGANKHWIMGHRGPDMSNEFQIGYKTSTASGNISATTLAQARLRIETSGRVIVSDAGGVANGVFGEYTKLVVDTTEAHAQLLATDTGSWGASFIMTNAPASGNNRHWWFHHCPATHGTTANSLIIRYAATNTAANIGGDGTGTTPVEFKTDGTVLFNAGSVGIGTTAPGSYKLRVQGDVYISGTLTEASSLGIKENIETYSPSLEKINKMRPVRFNKKKSKKKEVGLVAEELAEMFPELVETDEKGNAVGVNYSRAVAVLLHGFKELYKEVKELKEKI